MSDNSNNIINNSIKIEINNKVNNNIAYTGLLNQGGTCYLNSLLQTLFMIPEFRLNILNFTYNSSIHGNKDDCIPYQLQKLFIKLNLKKTQYTNTKGLTRSFQWHKNEVLYQHDIQELTRILFEAIEESLLLNSNNMNSLKNNSFIKELFLGNMDNVIKCLKCNNESTRKEDFLDLSLPVINQFENIKNSSLEMGFKNMFKQEVLCDENKYYCETCKEKVEKALKFTRINILPKVLMIQLNRFTYDYEKNSRIKIYNKVSFPLYLNSMLLSGNTNCYDLLNEIINNKEYIDIYKESYSRSSLKCYSLDNVDYELISIVIHSGSAYSGHYYSYIKSFENKKWYKFNDSSIVEIIEDDINSILGCDIELNTSSTAYILTYSKISKDLDKNKLILDKIESYKNKVPNDILNEIDIEYNKVISELNRVEENKIRELHKQIYTIIKAVYPPIHNRHKINKSFEILKSTKIKDLKIKLLYEFGIIKDINNYNEVDLSKYRLRDYNIIQGKLLDTYDNNKEEKTIEECGIIKYKYLTIEEKMHNRDFKQYNSDILNIKVFFWNNAIKNFLESSNLDTNDLVSFSFPHEIIEVNKNIKVIDLYYKIEDLFKERFASLNIKKDKLKLTLYRKHNYSCHYSDIIKINLSSKDINNDDEYQYDNNKSLIACMILDECEILVEEEFYLNSKFKKVFSDKMNKINIRFNNLVNKEKVLKGNIISLDYSFDNSFQIEKNKTIKDIKKKICDIINVNEEDIILKKYSHKGYEFKDLSESLLNFNYPPSSNDIYIEYGTQLNTDQYNINVSLSEIINLDSDNKNNSDRKYALFPFSIKFLGNLIASKKDSIKNLKDIIYAKFYFEFQEICLEEKISNEYNYKNIEYFKDKIDKEIFNFKDMYIREFLVDRPSKIYSDLLTLDKTDINNNKIYIVEFIKDINNKDIEDINQSKMQCFLRYLSPSNWTISNIRNIFLKKNCTIHELVLIISNIFKDININNLAFRKIINGYNQYFDDLRRLEFETPIDKENNYLESFPLFLNKDGSCLM